jgi:hypothetical protein
MWDKDALSCDDFMGEITVPLASLMSCRTMQGWFELEVPEGAYDNDHDKPLSGRVYLKLKWHTEVLLEGSMRTQVNHEQNTVIASCQDEEGGEGGECEIEQHMTLQLKRDKKRSASPPSTIQHFRCPASVLALSPGNEFAAASGEGQLRNARRSVAVLAVRSR